MADPRPAPVLIPGYSLRTATDQISSIVIAGRLPRTWWLGFGLSVLGLGLFAVAVGAVLLRGVGIWGIQRPVMWGFAITNFVWWIGIGHAGTLISAFLLLLRQEWRTSINRFAEAMTLFAVMCAGLFPILHLGRPQFFYWLVPYPNVYDVWPQFRSPLVWDVFAVSTYFTVSLLFWYVGLIPDFATLRDRAARPWVKAAYGILSMGWRGSARHWKRYESAYLLLAGLAAPLVISVHTVVSFDFSVGLVPGWHSTIFPPYFVAGAIFSGFAMVITITIPIRAAFGLHDFVTERHLDNMAKLMLATGLLVAYGYFSEGFMAWWSGDPYEAYVFKDRLAGVYAPVTYLVLFCNVLLPQALWSARVRRSVPLLFAVALLINVGMWGERFVIVVQSLHRDYLPSAWRDYVPTFWDWATFLGSIGLFATLMFLFVRFLPVISMSEMRSLIHHSRPDRESAT
ncbi:MAG: polysulfide reductase NrfD [Planctomycetaceae bacterium]|nr:polysulfide reductase NrfD [Planctomycetaceae bacterium]